MRHPKRLILAVCSSIAISSIPALAADPTLHEVYQAAEGGQLQRADSMMAKVLRDHPSSGKAHFVEAQLAAREGHPETARSELATAEHLAPGLPFAQPAAVAELRQHLATSGLAWHGGMPVLAGPAAQQIPWGMLIAGLVLLAAIVYFVRNMNRPRLQRPGISGSTPGSQPYGGYGGLPPAGPAAGVSATATGGSMGSGILGGLATGAALGAGMVAGESLMHRFFGGNTSRQALDTQEPSPLGDPMQTPDMSFDMGGSDFGVGDDGSWDDISSGENDGW